MSKHEVGLKLGDYEVLEDPNGGPLKLGEGAFGKTFLARQIYLDKRVALKVIHDHLLHDEGTRARFLEEARKQARLDHPNIAKIDYLGKARDGTDEIVYCAVEFCESGSLQDLMNRFGSISPGNALLLVRQAARGLSHAHDKGLVHRDIKPSNLLISGSLAQLPNVKIIDFGIVKSLEEEDHGTDAAYRTKSWEFKGTPLFCSPEQARKEPVDARSDIFSLGMTMWFLINDGSPLTGSSAQILDERCRSVGYEDMLPNSLPPSIHRLLARCLAVSPENRFRDCHELEAAAQACIEELRITWEQPVEREKGVDAESASRPSMTEHYSWQKEWTSATGEAYLGTEIATGRRVKVTRFDRFATGAGQFIKAAKLLEQIRHPNIVNYFSVREFREGWLVAREWVAGLDLMTFLQQTGPIKVRHASGILRQVAAALDFSAENHPAGLHDHPSSVILEITGDCEDHTPNALQVAVESGSIRAKMLPVLAEAAPLSTTGGAQPPSAVNTIIDTASNTDSGRGPTFSPIKSFCKLVYWIVGGRQVPTVRFEAVPGLEEGSNRIIRDVLSDKITGVKCAELCEQLLSIEGVGSSLAEWIEQIKDNLNQGFSELEDTRAQLVGCEESLDRLKREVAGTEIVSPEHVQGVVDELTEVVAHCVRRASGFNGLADEATTTAQTYNKGELSEKAEAMRAAVLQIEEKADVLRKSAGELSSSHAHTTSRKVAEKARVLASNARELGKKVLPIRRRVEGKPSFQIACEARKATGELLDELYLVKDELAELHHTLAQAERDLETHTDSRASTASPPAHHSLGLADNAIEQATGQVNAVRDLIATHLASHLNENSAATAARATQILALAEDLRAKALAAAANSVKARVKGDPDAAESAQRELSGLTTRLAEAEKSQRELKDLLSAGLAAAAAVPSLPGTTASPLQKAEQEALRSSEILETTRTVVAKATTDAENARVAGRLQRDATNAERMVTKADAHVAEAARDAQTILADLRKALKQRDATALAMHGEKARLWGDQIAEIERTVDGATSQYDAARSACECENSAQGLGILKAVEGKRDSLRKSLTELRALQKALVTQAGARIGEEKRGLPLWIKAAAAVLILGGIGAGTALYLKNGRNKHLADTPPSLPEDPQEKPEDSPGSTPADAPSEFVILEVKQSRFPAEAQLTLQPAKGGKPVLVAGEKKQSGVWFKAPRKHLSAGTRISLSAPGYEPLENLKVTLSDSGRIPLDAKLVRTTRKVGLAGASGQTLEARASGFYRRFYTQVVFTWVDPLEGETVPPEAEIAVDIAEALEGGATLPTGVYSVKLRRPKNAPPLTGVLEKGKYDRSSNQAPNWTKEQITFSADDRLVEEHLTVGPGGAPDAATLNLPAPPPPLMIGFSSIEDTVTGGSSIIPSTIVLRFPRIELVALAPGDDWSRFFAYEANIGATFQAVFNALQESARTIPQPPGNGDRAKIDQHLADLSTALGTATSARKVIPSSEDQLSSLVQMLEALYLTFAVGEHAAGGAGATAPGMASAFYMESLGAARTSLDGHAEALGSNKWSPETGSVLFADHPLLKFLQAGILQPPNWYEGMDEAAIAHFGAISPIFFAESIILNATKAIDDARSQPEKLSAVSMDFKRVLPPTGDKAKDQFAIPNQVEILRDGIGYFREYPMIPEHLGATGAFRFAVPYATQGQGNSFSIVVQLFTLDESRGQSTLGKEVPSRADTYTPLITPPAFFKEE